VDDSHFGCLLPFCVFLLLAWCLPGVDFGVKVGSGIISRVWIGLRGVEQTVFQSL
jgi:hypothetical protein